MIHPHPQSWHALYKTNLVHDQDHIPNNYKVEETTYVITCGIPQNSEHWKTFMKLLTFYSATELITYYTTDA